MLMSRRSYWWTDTPDGEDIIKKTNLALKVGYISGVCAAVGDFILQPQPNLRGCAFRAAAITVPAMGAAAVFSLTSQALCKNYPQLQPTTSYALGAAAASAVIGAAAQSPRGGLALGFWSAFAAYFFRDAMNFDFDGGLFGRFPTVYNNDDVDLCHDLRNAPVIGTTQPLPSARPAVPGSWWYNNKV